MSTIVPTTHSLSKINIRPEVTILSILQHLNYRPWFALAEFVDNSIQSFFNNQEKIRDSDKNQTQLKVEIEFHSDMKIIIRDNAAGIRESDFPRAFRPAEIPLDRSGLSEFGMGMKSAACWFAKHWSVRTKALGEKVERTVYLDINRIVAEKNDELAIASRSAHETEHYTEIVLWDLQHPPKGRTVQKVRGHLASIYRVYTRTGDLRLSFDGKDLSYESPKMLHAPHHKRLDGPIIEWKKEINFDFGEGQIVKGFAALRETASTSLAGFALFRRNRLIEGSVDETYRPQQIFGNSNSFRYQRLFGELHFEGFEVSHTKDGFRWEEHEEIFLEYLEKHLIGGDLNLLDQAEGHRAKPSKKSIEVKAVQATNNVAADLEAEGQEILENEAKSPSVPGPLPKDVPKSDLQASEKSIKFDDGKTLWEVTIRSTIDSAIGQWLRIGHESNRGHDRGKPVKDLKIDVSLSHPFVQKHLGSQNENLELFFGFACAIAISLILSAKTTGVDPNIPLHHLNTLLREALGK